MVFVSEAGAPHATTMLMKKTAIKINARNLIFSPSLLKSNYSSRMRWLEQQAKKDLNMQIKCIRMTKTKAKSSNECQMPNAKK
jgi:hypothetical protein